MLYKPINSLCKAAAILKNFTPHEPELSAANISRTVGIPKMTTHRILTTLTECGLLERSVKTGKYRIGPAICVLGSLYLSTTGTVRAAEPVAKIMNDLTNETVHVSIFDKGYITLIMKEESKHAIRLVTHIGSIVPAYASSMGKVFLSELTETEINSFYPQESLRPITEKTIATKTELLRELEKIRKAGVSFNREGSYEGVEGIGCAIRDASGRAVAAMAIAVPSVRINQYNRPRLATLVRLGASLVSYHLGYQDMANPVRDIQEIRSWWEQNQSDSVSPASRRGADRLLS